MKIYFTDAEGNKLCGILSNPSSTSIVILCHGFTSSKDGSTNTALEKMFNESGFASLRFDFFGHGESEGKFEEITITKAVDAILHAIAFVKEKGFTKIALVGSSFGGMSSIMAASKTNDLVVLALKSPVSSYLERELERSTPEELEKWKNQGFKIHKNSEGKEIPLNYSFFEDYKNNDGYEAAKSIKIPTLIVHGDADSSVPIQQSRKIAQILENCTLKEIPGADHWYKGPGEFDHMITLITTFVKEHLS